MVFNDIRKYNALSLIRFLAYPANFSQKVGLIKSAKVKAYYKY